MAKNALKGLAALLPPLETVTESHLEATESARPSLQDDALPPDEGFACMTCRDAGFVRGDLVTVSDLKDGRFEARAMPCPSCRPVPIAVGLPQDLDGKTFADFDLTLNPPMKAALDACRRVAMGEAWCALLVGDPGRGKSLLASAALAESNQPLPGRFWKWGDLHREINRLAYDDAGPRFPVEYVLKPWQTSRALLVLDDVGASKLTEKAAEYLYDIVDARYSAQLPTIVTTNNLASISEPVFSRLAVGLVACEGRDVRLSGASMNTRERQTA
jgi:DNA replication protein DnaC